jgi:hypothetical protein
MNLKTFVLAGLVRTATGASFKTVALTATVPIQGETLQSDKWISYTFTSAAGKDARFSLANMTETVDAELFQKGSEDVEWEGWASGDYAVTGRGCRSTGSIEWVLNVKCFISCSSPSASVDVVVEEQTAPTPVDINVGENMTVLSIGKGDYAVFYTTLPTGTDWSTQGMNFQLEENVYDSFLDFQLEEQATIDKTGMCERLESSGTRQLEHANQTHFITEGTKGVRIYATNDIFSDQHMLYKPVVKTLTAAQICTGGYQNCGLATTSEGCPPTTQFGACTFCDGDDSWGGIASFGDGCIFTPAEDCESDVDAYSATLKFGPSRTCVAVSDSEDFSAAKSVRALGAAIPGGLLALQLGY